MSNESLECLDSTLFTQDRNSELCYCHEIFRKQIFRLCFGLYFGCFKGAQHCKFRLSQKTKKLEYQKCLLTLDVGWSNKLSCKISAFQLENRKSCGHLKFQQATNKIKKSLISKIEFYLKKLLFLPLKIDYEVKFWYSNTRNIRILILAIFQLFIVVKSLLKLQMAT